MAIYTDHIKSFRDMDRAVASADPARFRRAVLEDFIAALNAQFPEEISVFITEMPLCDLGYPYADVGIGSASGDHSASVLVDLGSWHDMCQDVVDIFRQASTIGLSKESENTSGSRPLFTEERQAASCRLDDCMTDIGYLAALERTP